MSQVLFTSDLHLGHKNICKYRPEFRTMQEHDEYLISKIVRLDKRTVLYILGDFLFKGEHYKKYMDKLASKRCRIKLVMGNHDSIDLYKENIFEMQLPLFCYKNLWVSHAPIHTNEMRGRSGNIHGHLHKEFVTTKKVWGRKQIDTRYFNVNIDVNNYMFVAFDNIKKHFEGGRGET